jgi:hypothetical protein
MTARDAVEGATPRTPARWLAALVLPVGPAAVALLRFVMPYGTTDDATAMATKVTADPGAQSLLLWLGFLACLTLVPGTLWVGGLTRRRVPRLTAVALLLLVPAYLALGWLTSADLLLWAGAQADLDVATLAALTGSAHPTVTVAETVFVVGHVLGTILLGVAMWISGCVPRWAAVLTAVSQPLHVIAAVVVLSHPLDLAAWGMQAVGFGAAAIVFARSSHEDATHVPARC